MAVPDPPFSTPRIMKVLEPSAGHYEVIVRMDPTLASKFPDKPFGTAITEIGLAAKDTAKYVGYTLVSIEPADKGAKDHYWIFQKLDGPAWTTTSKSKDNLTPQKYRSQTVVVKTEQEVAPDTAPTTLAGDLVSSVVTQTPNTGKAVLSEVTETIAENLLPLEGEEYGEIVTKSVSEVLVNDGTPADSGFNVISSMVEPIGNGKSVKQTKTAKGGWSDPINKEVSKEGADTPPPRYRKDLTRTKTTRKIAASAIPITPSLSGDEVAKSYQKETPDRAEETVVSQSFTLNTSSVDEAVEQKPFVKITSKMTPGTAPVVPASGNGSAKLVYEAPNGSKIYENTAEIATARTGPSGEEKDTKPFVTIKTAKRFSTTANISTLTGSSNVVFNDGATQIYEVSEVTSTGRFGSAGVEQQTKPFVSITSTATYQNTGTLGAGEVGSTNKIYDDGSTTVYEKKVDTAVARPGPAGTEKDEKPFVKIETKKRYDSTGNVTTQTGSSNVVFNDGKVQVYEVSEVTSTAKPGLKGIETNAQQWGSIKNTTDYTTSSNAPSGGSVNLVYNDGQTTVYEATTTTATTSGTGKDVDSQQWGQIEWNGTYAKTTSGTRSRQVWSNGVDQVFFNETATLKVSGGTKEIDPNAWGSITWDGTYATSSGGQKSRQVARVGDTTVFLNENATLQPKGSTKEVDANAWGKITWNGTYSSSDGGDKSRQVYSGPGGSVYLNENATLEPQGSTEETDANSWGSIKWIGTYSKTANAGQSGKSRQVYSGPGGSVYLNETPTVTPLEGSFPSAKKTTPTYKITETTSFSKSSEAAEPNSQTRLVFAQGTERVFEKTVRTIEPNGRKIYYSVINAQTPSVLKAIETDSVERKPNSDGPVADKICVRIDIEEGYSGLFPAKITEYFTKDPAAAETFKPLVFKPSRIDYDGILFQLAIGETLHTSRVLADFIGTEHPIYKPLETLPLSFRTIEATEPTDIPTGWQNYAIQIDPFEDGYLVKEIQVRYKD
jgi:hypothetical protein